MGLGDQETQESRLQRYHEYQKILLDIIEKYVPGCSVYLYGSRARGDYKEGSDYDLALDDGKKIDFNQILKIYGDIEEAPIPLFVDVIDFHSISDAMRQQIEQDKIVWKK